MSEPVLSFTAQPHFAALVDRLIAANRDREQLTLICGAGISADAGLPRWSELVDRMCSAVTPKKLRDVVRADPTDDLRKVDYIVRLRSDSQDLPDILKGALYRDLQRSTQPGHLADAIARLSRTWEGSANLVTTNFDDQLEQALARYHDETNVTSFGLEEVNAFEQSVASNSGQAAVMHLHGMVAPNRPTLEPLVLSQSFFLKHGPKAQTILRKTLTGSQLSLLVGVSLADPNLVGPLNDLSAALNDEETLADVFLLVVPDPIEGIERDLVYDYARRRCEYFEQEFRINTILLKSYWQVAQLLYELSTALRCPADYECSDDQRSQRYGHRLQRELTKAYTSLDATAEPHKLFDPAGGQARGISDRLYTALTKDDGPVPILRDFAEKMTDPDVESAGTSRSVLRGEDFGLFLWLRVRACELPGEAYPPFTIRLIGCSAYVHREAWSLNKEVTISPQSGYPAADAMFYGHVRVASLAKAGENQMWRSCVTSPITVISEEDAGGAPSQIGAVTLNSTYQYQRYEEEAEIAAAKHEQGYEPSILSFLNASEMHEVASAAERAAIEAINGDGAKLLGPYQF